MLFDVNCYLGAWPFSLAPEQSAAQFAQHLSRSGIRRAAVSPFGAVFQPEPMPANRALFAATRLRKNFTPLPVVNPALADWRSQLAECAAKPGVRAVRLFPNYHNYSLAAPMLEEFVAELRARRLRLVLTARLEDERHRYFGLTVKGVPSAELAAFLEAHRSLAPLITGLSVGEALALAEKHENFSADLAYQENIALAAMLRGKLPAARLMFGTLAPLVSAQAQTAKLAAPGFTAAERRRIGFANAEKFFL